MASPIGHGLTGIAIYIAAQPGKTPRLALPGLAVSAVLACLMDGDFLVGFIMDKSYHHGHVHSLGFALAAAGILAMIWRPGQISRGRGFLLYFALIGSHALIDTVTMDTSFPFGTMLFWPLTDTYYISPFPLFLDVWRGSVEIVFGYHNVAVAFRELAFSGLLLLIVFSIKSYPGKWVVSAGGVALISGLIAVVFHQPLAEAATKQLEQFYGEVSVDTHAPPVKGVRGILFSGNRSGNEDIVLIQPDSGEMKYLTTDPADDVWPVWSADGSRILFQSNRSGSWGIYEMNSDGTGVRTVVDFPGEEESPWYSQDGKSLIFQSNREGKYELYTMAFDGTGLKKLVDRESHMDILASVSPADGTVAFTSRSKLIPGWHIYTVPFNGGELKRVSPQHGCRAKWSPDGKYLAYVSKGDGDSSDIWIFESGGYRLHRVTRTSDYCYDPCWSPDGQKICFVRGRDAKSGWDLWIVGVNGDGLRPLTFEGAGDRYPHWR